MATLTKNDPLQVDYDRAADVLYISRGESVPADSESHGRGILLRFAFDNDAHTGVTVIGFQRNRWCDDMAKLAKIIGEHLAVAPALAANAIRTALEA